MKERGLNIRRNCSFTLTSRFSRRNAAAIDRPHHPRFRNLHPLRYVASRLLPKRTTDTSDASPPPSVFSFRSSSLPHTYGVVFLPLPRQDVPHSLPLHPLLACGRASLRCALVSRRLTP